LLADLLAAGHEADGLRDEGLIRAPDDVVLDLVRRESRVLLTLDKGIADVRAHPSEAHPGIVLFRPPAAGRGTILLFVRRHLASLFERNLTGRLLVITDHGIRAR
jgi:predicted nuclease of predicted toxin-antitoxin system